MATRTRTRTFTRRTVAERAGVALEDVDRLIGLGILPPRAGGRFSIGDVQRVAVALGLERGGLPLPVIGEAIRRGDVSLDFADHPSYRLFATTGHETFRELSARTGVPLELVTVIREAMGFAQPSPDDRVRDEELQVVPIIQLQLRERFRPAVIDRWLRGYGDSMRRMAEIEADWFRSAILDPLFEAGRGWQEVSEVTGRLEPDLSDFVDQAILALYHGQQANTWMRNIFEVFEAALTSSGAHVPVDRPPADRDGPALIWPQCGPWDPLAEALPREALLSQTWLQGTLEPLQLGTGRRE